MAATITFDGQPGGRTVAGDRMIRRGTIQLGTYVSGGIAVTKASFEMPVALNDLRVDPAAGYVFRWDKTNGKVMAYLSAGSAAAMTEVGSVDLSTAVARYVATGH